MKLAYRELPSGPAELPAVVLHDRGVASIDRVVAVVRDSGAVGRVVAPFGDYGYTASGMELAGLCWYRTVPGFAGADPISLAKAVVQVGDLLADLSAGDPALADPVLVGLGEGAVVALGAALLCDGHLRGAVCIDGHPAHMQVLPERLFTNSTSLPLLVMSTGDHAAVADASETGPARIGNGRAAAELLDGRGIHAAGWHWPGGPDEKPDEAMAEEIGRWLDDG